MVMIILENTCGCDFTFFDKCSFDLDRVFCERLDFFEKQKKEKYDKKRKTEKKISLEKINSIMYGNVQKELARRAIEKVNEASVGLKPISNSDII